VAIAWLLARGTDIVPIPGTKHIKYLEQKVKALDVGLTADDISILEGLAANIMGTRYGESQLRNLGI